MRGCRELPPGRSTGVASHAHALAYISMGRCAPQAVPRTLLACIESCKICSEQMISDSSPGCGIGFQPRSKVQHAMIGSLHPEPRSHWKQLQRVLGRCRQI